MTGFGDARLQDDRWTVSVEVRSVNNRHLKLMIKVSEPYSALEPELERLVRETVRRGTVNLQIRVERPKKAEDYRLNMVALASYRDQLQAMQAQSHPPSSRPIRLTSYRAQIQGMQGSTETPLDLAALLALPGVVEDRRPPADDPHEDWPALSAAVSEALRKFQVSRGEEGRAMAEELLNLGKSIADQLTAIADRGPDVVANYHKRLTERVQALVQKEGITIEARDLVREIGIFSERADISEEVIRLRAHLGQYLDVIHETESSGRKLEFVVQEMGRETNTIGSKANDIEISRGVVEIKGMLEKIRELIQNVE